MSKHEKKHKERRGGENDDYQNHVDQHHFALLEALIALRIKQGELLDFLKDSDHPVALRIRFEQRATAEGWRPVKNIEL